MTKGGNQRTREAGADASKSGERLAERITVWAVGHVKNPSFVALQVNEHAPFLLRIADARKIAAALQSEVDVISKLSAGEG